MSDSHNAFTPGMVMGVGITALGAALLLDTLGILRAGDLLRFWPVLLILFGASLVSQAVCGTRNADAAAPRTGRRRHPFLAFVMMWIVIWAIASHGSLNGSWNASWNNVRRAVSTSDRDVSMLTIMGRDTRVPSAKEFRRADMTTVMGHSTLDLRKLDLQPGEQAVVNVLGMMGEVELVIPEDWVVDVEATPFMGGVRDSRWPIGTGGERRGARTEGGDEQAAATEPAPKVIVRGLVMMGQLRIRS